MKFGFFTSLTLHVLIIGWMVLNLHQTDKLDVPDVVPISVAIVTPSEFTRMKQGDQYTKNLESKAADKPTEDDSKKEAEKPKAAPPAAAPPPPPVAEAPPPPPEPVKPPDPPKAEPPKADPIKDKLAALPPPPPEPEGPTPDEQALLQQKLEQEQKAAAEAKAKADAEAKAKAEAEKKKREEEHKKKLADDKRKKDEEKKRLAKLEAEKKKKFDAAALEKMLADSPEDAEQKALLDKSKKPTGGKASGDSKTATNLGPSAGTKEGRDTVLSAREVDMLKSIIDSKLRGCWRLPAGGGGSQTPVVFLTWRLKPDGTLDGEPLIVQPQNSPLFQVAAEAAIRAVKTCAPFELPPDKYTIWREIVAWKFDPSKML